MTPCRIIRGLAVGGFGAVVAAITIKTMRKEYDDKLQEGLDEVREYYGRDRPEEKGKPDEVVRNYVGPVAVNRPKFDVPVYEPREREDAENTLHRAMTDYSAKQASVSSTELDYKVTKAAWVIDKGTYYTDEDSQYPNMEKVSLTYYEGDDVMETFEGDILTDYRSIVGTEFYDCFIPDGRTRSVWVRNVVLSVDYEIDLNEGLYADIVAGVGPNTLPDYDDDEDPLRPGRRG